MKKLDDHRLFLGKKEYKPIMLGGMGMDISTTELVLATAKMGGIAHLSDALVKPLADRMFGTQFVKERIKAYKSSSHLQNKAHAQFDQDKIYKAVHMVCSDAMERKEGDGGVFLNVMEKLTMNNPKLTLSSRANGALDAGIDGISFGAGLHTGTFGLIEDNPRFRDAKLGIIVSSVRALKIFLTKTKKFNRLPDYVVVEGPLAGGHLGFKLNEWQKFDLKIITKEVIDFVNKNDLPIAVIPAGGVFTGTDAVNMIEMGASAVQVATRFIVTKECGFPAKTQQEFFKAEKEDIEVNMLSPTGYPMRMLKNSPCAHQGIKPNCEALGFILDKDGDCAYIPAYYRALAQKAEGEKLLVSDKTCLCTYMKSYGTWTCGAKTYRLKTTSNKLPDGSYQQLTVKDVFNDYMFSEDHTHKLPELPAENAE